jgi:hypothetical protein
LSELNRKIKEVLFVFMQCYGKAGKKQTDQRKRHANDVDIGLHSGFSAATKQYKRTTSKLRRQF